MPFGKAVLISEDAVQEVLASLVNISTTLPRNVHSLFQLVIVEHAKLSQTTPLSDKQSLYILQGLLVDIISSELDNIRRKLFIETPEVINIGTAIKAIRADAKNGSTELVSWSILFYIYAQPDLGISLQRISNLMNLSSRTIRRYRRQGIALLAHKLWDREVMIRKQLYKKRLVDKYRLFASTENCIIRMNLIEPMIDAYNVQNIKHFCMYGDSGIGKTTLIKQFLAMLVDHITVDYIIWIEVNSAYSVVDQILMDLGQQNSMSLTGIFQILNCVVIIEDSNQIKDLKHTLEKLEDAIVIYSSQEYLPHLNSAVFHSLDIPPLTIEETRQLAELYSNAEVANKYYVDVYNESGGNPSLALQVLSHKMHFTGKQPTALTAKVQQLLVFVPMSPDLSRSDFEKFVDVLEIDDKDIQRLFDDTIIKEINDCIVCCHDLKPLIYQPNIEASIHIFLSVYEDMESHITSIFNFIVQWGAAIGESLMVDLLRRFWRDIHSYLGFIQWELFLSTMEIEDPIVNMIKAISVNSPKERERVLLALVERTGHHGQFSIQAEILLELIKIYRHEGRYQLASYYLEIINTSLINYLNSEVIIIFKLESAQLLVSRSNFESALNTLAGIKTQESQLLIAQVHHRLNNFDDCIGICNMLLAEDNFPKRLTGVVYNLLGMCVQELDPELSIQYYGRAREYFRYVQDIYRLARCSINFAVCFIRMNELDRAMSCLKQAELMCTSLNDLVGLTVINKNKNYIRSLLLA